MASINEEVEEDFKESSLFVTKGGNDKGKGIVENLTFSYFEGMGRADPLR